MTIFFDKLSEHYEDNFDAFSENMTLNKKDDLALVDIFENLSEYYMDGLGSELNPNADELWIIYD